MTDDSREFGPTNVALLPLGIGTHGHGDAFGGIGREKSLAILDEVHGRVQEGQRILIDTAPRYGHGMVESWLGEMADRWSDRFVIATKCGRRIDPERDNQKDFSYSFLASDIERSLKRLRTDQLFLTQLHNPTIEEISSGDIFATMERFRDEGLIQWYGLSIDSPAEAVAAIRTCVSRGFRGLAAIQFIYSAMSKEGTEELLQLAQKENIALVAREVLFRGFLTDRFLLSSRDGLQTSAVLKLTKQFGLERIRDAVLSVNKLIGTYGIPLTVAALRFAIDTPGVTTTLVGANRINYLDDAWPALEMKLPSELLEALAGFSDIKPSELKRGDA